MTYVLNVDAITRNMKRSGIDGKSVLAKKHKPYAQSKYGITVHDVEGVRLDFMRSGRVGALALFVCNQSTMAPVFFDDPDQPHTRRCKRCVELREAA